MPLPNTEQRRTLLPNQEQAPTVLTNQERLTQEEADDLSARLLNDAIEGARLTNGDIAFILGISESLVRKMRSPHTRERMSHAQMLRLGVARPLFYIELTIATDAHTGWFRRFALQLQQQASALFAVAGR